MSHRTRLALGLAVCTALVSACSGGSGATGVSHATPTHPESAASVTKRLGAVPIPSAPAAQATPVATRQHPQLLAMGEPLKVELGGAAAAVTTFGPHELTPYRGGTTLPTQTVGIITITATPTRGGITLRAADFLSRDESGKIVALQPAGPSTVTATPGHPARLRIKGTFRNGAAQVTWNYRGAVIAIWDFNVELD